MPSHGKPRTAHVRTGCLTCKDRRRRVKCPEERPHCSRCIKGGFSCAGYVVPKVWLFKSRAETCGHVKEPGSESLRRQSAKIRVDQQSPRQGANWSLNASPLSLIKQGNSDPFNAYAIRLGPRETFLLRIVHSATVSTHTPSTRVWRNWKEITASDVLRYHAICLENETTAYGILARIAAESLQVLKHHGTALSTSVLQYMTLAQASLRKNLSVIGSSPMPPTENLRATIWAGSFLADAETSLGSQNADLHIRAMTNIMRRYIQAEMLLSDTYSKGIMHLMYLDTMTATIAFRSSHLDNTGWLPRISEGAWHTIQESIPIRRHFRSRHTLHNSITDTVIRDVMLSQKSLYEIYDKLQEIIAPAEIDRLCNALVFEELLHFGQLLNVAVNAKEMLDNPGLTSAQVQHQNARIYVSVAVQLWIRLTSPSPIATNTFLDTAPNLLLYLKSAITSSGWDMRIFGTSKETYAAAKLWALSIGVITERQRRDSFPGGNSVCGTWYHERFREQAILMRIHTWQEAVTVLDDFLNCDYVQPHISEWWPLLFPEGTGLMQFGA